ncbi:LuxR family transcriptional regulator [Streptomyces lacrimifluminis]|uniref:LuxR family transcriptional regulator n=1 Tax=Streptomyces lacrimifluminis TaxID=1500077 RepID=A0A917LCP4_9ACTN|nr:LuxR C-terminal-related transcriptional regulator [Streptomyces lacrimifluminis]GGJ56542.1 LuxR family transcriptional regulator [Streptomyces lacrimifluminis]
MVSTFGPYAGNLPAASTSFVGRRQDVAEIRRSLSGARLLTLTGAGGIGKTRLALEAATVAGEDYPEGVWLVDLAPVRHPAALASATATALGLPDLGARPPLEQLTAHLAERRTLLVLDNCEHLVDACAELARLLLSAAPGLRILTTSRRTLDVVGECVFSVAPLSPADSLLLLGDRAAAVDADFRIEEADEAHVSRLCTDLDGLPLAIELAASRLRTLTVEQAVDRLEDRFALLADIDRSAPPRQRTLRAAIDGSYELCAPAEQLLWQRLSVFAGGFALDAAEDVCAGHGLSPYEVLDLLDRLVSQSIVLITEREGQPRYRLLETIREYGRERLAWSGEQERLLRRHRDFFLSLAERTAADWFGPGQEQALARLRAEHDNLLAALEHGRRAQTVVPVPARARTAAAESAGRAREVADPGDTQAWLALAAALCFHWCCNGFIGEGRRQFDRVLAAAPAPTPARAAALWSAAWVCQMQGDLDAADRWLDEAEELGERLGDPLVRPNVEGMRGTLALYRGRPHEAVPLLEGAVAAQSTLGGEPGTLRWLFQLTLAQVYLGDPGAAETGRRAVAVSEAHGERLTRAYALWVLGFGAWLRGSPEESGALMAAALEIHRGFNDHAGVVMALEVLAWSIAAFGDHERAALLLGALRPLSRELSPSSAGAFAEPHARCEEAIVEALGRAAYDKAFAEGGSYDSLPAAIALALGTGKGPRAAVSHAPLKALSRREREVAALVAEGMSNRQIATALGRSPRTVTGHVENILAKLGLGSRTQVGAWWTVNGETIRGTDARRDSRT